MPLTIHNSRRSVHLVMARSASNASVSGNSAPPEPPAPVPHRNLPQSRRTCTLVNARTARVVCHDVQVAASFLTRLVGLLGRCSLPHGQGLWIQSCSSIHTLFMRFSIDVVALDRHGRVLRTIPDVRPWSIPGVPRATRSILELPAGHLARHSVNIGDNVWPTYA